MESPYRFFTVESSNEATIVTLRHGSPFNEATFFAVQAELLGFVEVTRPAKLVVSLQHIEAMVSSMVGVLISLKRKVVSLQPHGTVALCALNEHSQEVFNTIDPKQSLFPRYPTAGEAVATP
jgi:anti-anti-sigma regulatory factor